MSEPQFDTNEIEVPCDISYADDYAIIRYKDGREFKVHGYGAMRDTPLDLDPRIDLTQPIYEQAMRLNHTGENSEQTSHEAA